jgi:predicted phosphodiesterase
VKQRKPILIIDDTHGSQRIKKIFNDNKIEFVEYNIKKFESCCGELPTTKAPSVIAVEGIYKDEDKIKEYIKLVKGNQKKYTKQQTNIPNNIKIKEGKTLIGKLS